MFGLITPPYGLSLLVASKFVGVRLQPGDVSRSLPIYVVFFVTIAFTVLFPGRRALAAEAVAAGIGRLLQEPDRHRLHLPAVAANDATYPRYRVTTSGAIADASRVLAYVGEPRVCITRNRGNETMPRRSISRRRVLQGLTATPSPLPVLGRPAWAAAPAPTPVTPELIEAAKKEGKVSWYTAVDLPVAERIAKAFEAKYPGIAMRVERSGAERIFQRIGQEYGSKIYAVDVRQQLGCGAFHRLEARRAAGALRPRGRGAPTIRPSTGIPTACSPAGALALRDRLQHQAGEGGGGAQELRRPARPEVVRQDRQGPSRLQRHHHDGHLPDRARCRLGVFREAQQAEGDAGAVGADPPKKLALGERAIMADGNEYNLFQLKEKGEPVEIVYPTEGTPIIVGPSGVMKDAPNPNAARLLQSFMFSRRVPAADRRLGRPALVPRAGEGQARPQAARPRSS